MPLLGIDIGGTKTAVLTATPAGEILGRVQFPTRPERGIEAFLDDVARAAAEVTEAASCVTAASVAVGGPMNEAGGVLLAPPHLPGWNDVPLPERLRERLGLPVHWMHDARAGAWAEWQFGVGRESGVCRMAFLTFATGFGMGVVLDGRLLDIPGEVGHWRVAEDGPGMFGKRGSLEGLASGAGIAAQGGRPVEELAEAARAGDAKALALFDAVAVQVGRQCARLIDLFGLDAVALGTIAVKCEDLLIDRICEVARQEALPHLAKNCRIAPSALGEELGDLACLSAALSRGLGGESALGPRACGQVAESARLLDVLLADKVFLDAVDSGAARIVEALAAGHKVLTCGNGGSATDAAHLAEELIGRYRGDGPSLAAVNLCADGSVLTCIANDYGFDAIFSRQVEGMGRKGDVLVAFTTSGNSENVNRALHVARERGVFTIALTGKNGGAARQIADLAIHVPHAASERIQEIHTFVLHAFCEGAEARFRSPGKKP